MQKFEIYSYLFSQISSIFSVFWTSEKFSSILKIMVSAMNSIGIDGVHVSYKIGHLFVSINLNWTKTCTPRVIQFDKTSRNLTIVCENFILFWFVNLYSKCSIAWVLQFAYLFNKKNVLRTQWFLHTS